MDTKLDRGRRLLRGLMNNEQVLNAISGALEIEADGTQSTSIGNAKPSSAPANGADNDRKMSVEKEVARLFGRESRDKISDQRRFFARKNLIGKRQV